MVQRKRKWAALTAAAMLGGCDSGGGDTRQTPARAPLVVANPFHDRLLQLSDLQRDAAFRGAIRSARESCDRVEASSFQQDHGNLKMWTASCRQSAYAVFVAPNGDIQVRDCADAATLKLPACRPATG